MLLSWSLWLVVNTPAHSQLNYHSILNFITHVAQGDYALYLPDKENLPDKEKS
jgi:hypothetical protein